MPENSTTSPQRTPRRDRRELYPAIEPFAQHHIDMPGGHRIYVEECGNPDGRPVVVLHGGPGGGCSPGMRRFFDPSHYRVVLFDQRGCGRSLPNAAIEGNTTWDLIDDMERIRTHLGIEDWVLFGGSWGATLALTYGQTHPERVTHFVLRGIFMMTKAELDWFYGGGAGKFFPEEWARFSQMVPEKERGDLIAAYGRRLFDDDEVIQIKFARVWAGWESALASFTNRSRALPSGTYSLAFARLENHYFANMGFLPEDNHLLRNMDKIKHIKAMIVQGRYDMICPPRTAYELHEAWPNSSLYISPYDGHALSEPGISQALLDYMDKLRG